MHPSHFVSFRLDNETGEGVRYSIPLSGSHNNKTLLPLAQVPSTGWHKISRSVALPCLAAYLIRTHTQLG